jgi:hypothetical protein
MTSKNQPQLFTAPVFKNANGDQLIVTFSDFRKYLSSRQVKCNWPGAQTAEIHFVATIATAGGRKQFDLTIKQSVQISISRDQIQHRYTLCGFGKTVYHHMFYSFCAEICNIVLFSNLIHVQNSCLCSSRLQSSQGQT